ncbi:MAG: hypothetical protein HUU37_00910 [Bdellovibrionales bacterium]|nr:hypothetical protein [Bdellovibrionales bacterium]
MRLLLLPLLLFPQLLLANAPVQTLKLLETNLKRACNSISDDACPESLRKVEVHRKEVENIYASKEFQAALALVYQSPDKGQAGLLNKGKENYTNALERTKETKTAIDASIETLKERERVHSSSDLKTMIKVFREALSEQSGLLGRRMTALQGYLAELNAPKADPTSLTGIAGAKPEERNAVKEQLAPVEKKMEEFISDPGLGTGRTFLAAVQSFCKQPGSAAVAQEIGKNCQELQNMDFPLTSASSRVASLVKSVKTMSPAMMFASGSSRADVEKRIRVVTDAAGKIAWDMAGSPSGSRPRRSGISGADEASALVGSSHSATAPLPPLEEKFPSSVSETPALGSASGLVKAALTAGSPGLISASMGGASSEPLGSEQLRGVRYDGDASLFDATHSVMRERWRAGAFRR